VEPIEGTAVPEPANSSLHSPVNRRSVLRLFGAAAAAVPIGGLAAACGSSSGDNQSSAGTPSGPSSTGGGSTTGGGGASSAGGVSSSASSVSSSAGGASSSSGGASSPAAQDVSGTLVMAYLGDATQQKAFQALFDEFNKTYPKVQVKATGIAAGDWGTFASTIATQIAGGKVFDIVDVATEGQLLMSSKGVLEPLDDFIARDKAVVDNYYNDIDPHLKEWSAKYGSPDGKTYFIPGGYNTVCMYCNTDVFSKAGVELPTDTWSWDDFLAAGQQIKDKTGAFMLGIGYGFPFVDIMPWLLTNGASTLDADWKNPTLGTPEAVAAATFVKRMLDAGLSPKPGGAFDAASQYQKGKLATLGGGRWPTLDIRRLKMVDKTQIVPWPMQTKPGSPAGWDGWPIMKASQNKEAAWAFLKWIMSPDASKFYAQVGGTNVPARNSVASSSVFTDDAPKGTENLMKAITYATPIPSPARGTEVQNVITKAWQAAILGTSPVQQAFDNADSQLKPLL
jgi:multiple sugar transport system substrate-binding protein